MGMKSQGYGGQRAKDLVRDPESVCMEGQGRMKLTSGKREMERLCKKVLKTFGGFFEVRQTFGTTLLILLILFCTPSCVPPLPYGRLHLDKIRMPPGFRISVYVDDVPNARSMVLGQERTLFVGTRNEGKVYAIPDRNKDNKGDEVIVLAEGLYMPNGVAFRDGALYVAEVNRILRYDNVEDHLKDSAKPVVVNDQFRSDSHHGWKYIAFGPDGMLYVPVGAPCNVCVRDDNRYASLMRMKPDGSHLEIFASGIRNTVGFDWHPETEVLWFTNNGRDWMGDDLPPDMLHRAPEQGLHFGFPYCHAGDIPDPKYGKIRGCDEFTGPSIELGPHVAPGLGEEEGTVEIVRGFLHVEIEGLPRELKAEMDRAVEISENSLL